jgi:hypothetical protein
MSSFRGEKKGQEVKFSHLLPFIANVKNAYSPSYLQCAELN